MHTKAVRTNSSVYMYNFGSEKKPVELGPLRPGRVGFADSSQGKGKKNIQALDYARGIAFPHDAEMKERSRSACREESSSEDRVRDRGMPRLASCRFDGC